MTRAVENGLRFASHVLQSLRDEDTEQVWQRRPAAVRKLLILDAADRLGDLRLPRGNRLEKLRGDRANTYSMRAHASGASASAGRPPDRKTSRSCSTTEETR